MSELLSQIEHEGVIKEISDAVIKVAVKPVPACVSCEARRMCMINECSDEKIIDVVPDGLKHEAGDKVVVLLTLKQGQLALFLGYILPFIIVFLTLFISLQILKNEAVAGMISLGILFPYYAGLYIFRKSIKQSFEFYIKKV